MVKKAIHIPYGKRSTKDLLSELPAIKEYVKIIISRLRSVTIIPEHARVLDVGASVGRFTIACNHLGYVCEGVEPNKISIFKAKEISKQLNIPIPIKEGDAESIPYDDNSFDVVIASSVIEHVLDVEKSFDEMYRVLKPGGIFWFSTASSMCPRQGEIRGFPFFGWYPDFLKLRIMNWAKRERPSLVGYANYPAIHWFTPSKARKLLKKSGFKKVYDRWDLRGESESGRLYRIALQIIRTTKLSKAIADIVVPMCSYAAIK